MRAEPEDGYQRIRDEQRSAHSHGCFFGILAAMALWEVLAPKRALSVSKTVRWVNNLGLVFFNSFLLRLIFPAAAVGMATFSSAQRWGMFNYCETSFWLAVIVSVTAMDFIIYLQHVMVHAVPALWRLHRMHHADLDFDVTTGARFHPLEIILSMLIKFAASWCWAAGGRGGDLRGAAERHRHVQPRQCASARGGDRLLRWSWSRRTCTVCITRSEDDETNSNFGFNLPWWDRLFGTYRDQPRAGHDAMTIGIHKYRTAQEVSWLPGMLWLPFRGKINSYAINRRRWGTNNER